jgi:hypothetical protein
MSEENEPGSAGYGEPKDHTPNVRPPSGGKAKGASAEHMAPPVLHLEAHHIAKLFKGKMPPIGSKIKVHGLVHVGAYNEGADGPPSGGKAKGGEGNTARTMALHFHKMDIGTDNQTSDTDRESQSAKGAKAEMDKALARQAGGRKKTMKGVKREGEVGEGQEGEERSEGADNAPRGSNGPSGRA